MVRKIYDLSIFEDVREMFVNDITLSWREVEWGEPEKMENINYKQSKRGNIERESLMISGWLSSGWTVQLWLSRLGTGLTVTHQELANKWISTAGRQDGRTAPTTRSGRVTDRGHILQTRTFLSKRQGGVWWLVVDDNQQNSRTVATLSLVKTGG